MRTWSPRVFCMGFVMTVYLFIYLFIIIIIVVVVVVVVIIIIIIIIIITTGVHVPCCSMNLNQCTFWWESVLNEHHQCPFRCRVLVLGQFIQGSLPLGVLKTGTDFFCYIKKTLYSQTNEMITKTMGKKVTIAIQKSYNLTLTKKTLQRIHTLRVHI